MSDETVQCFGCQQDFPPDQLAQWRDALVCPKCLQVTRHIAFQGPVQILRWEDTSTSGPKARFGLHDRDALGPFEKATKRRGKRAGQRYRLIVCNAQGEHVNTMECFLAGAQWAHGTGASITLAFESIDFWRRYQTGDQAEDAGTTFVFTMVELQDDENPVDQVQRDALEEATKRKGGPKSKHVAQRCRDKDFQEFVSYRLGLPRDRWHLTGADSCDRWVKQMCAVASKIDFDYDAQAWERYEKLVQAPFLSWARATYGDKYSI